METTNNTKGKRRIDFSFFINVAIFFVFEVLAIIAFSLGNNYVLYSILSLILLIFLILITFKQINKDGLSTFAFFLFPLFIFGLLSALSYFNKDPAFALFGGLTVFIPFAITCIACCGYLASSISSFSIKKAMFVIYSALAILSLINLIITLVQFTPFYTLLYRDKYIYYDGEISNVPISGMAFALFGFSSNEVSIEYFSLFPTLLLTAFIPMMNVSLKKQIKLFICYLSFVVIGFYSLLLTVSLMTLISDCLVVLVILAIYLLIRFNYQGKIIKRLLISLCVLGSLVFIVMLINSFENGAGFINSFQSLIKNNSLLDRIFNSNRLVAQYNPILRTLTSTSGGSYIYLFGFFPGVAIDVGITNSWLFDNIMTSGIFGGLFFIFSLIIGIRRLGMYYRYSLDTSSEKGTIISFISVFLIYSLINYDASPFIFKDYLYPLYLSGPFLIVLFLFSYTNCRSTSIEQKKSEEILENKDDKVLGNNHMECDYEKK